MDSSATNLNTMRWLVIDYARQNYKNVFVRFFPFFDFLFADKRIN